VNLLKLFQSEYKGKEYSLQKGLVNEVLAEPFFYSVDVGPVHIISIKSEDNAVDPYERAGDEAPDHPLDFATRSLRAGMLPEGEKLRRFEDHFGHRSPQLKWLEQDLGQLDRNKTPFVIVFTHRPIFSINYHHPLCSKSGDWYMCNFRDTYAPIYQKNKVNLVMSGHSHHYMLSTPIKYEGGTASPGVRGEHPVYTIVGTGGYELSSGFFQPRPDIIKISTARHFGYGLLEPRTSESRMKWVYYEAQGSENEKDKVDVTAMPDEYI
jgi:hypothetical protein